MRILITGGRGQLATDLTSALQGQEVRSLGRRELDVTDHVAVRAALDDFRPEVLINTAAYQDVDGAETDPERAFSVNAAAPRRMAVACRERGIRLVHLSSGYVFDGGQRDPYREDHRPAPISVYGIAKAAGEAAVRVTTDDYLLIRSTGLYGYAGLGRPRANLVEKLLGEANSGRPVTVVTDQYLTPSFTADVAPAIAALVRAGVRGVYHVTNTGGCTQEEFAETLFRLAGMRVTLDPRSQSEIAGRARRPAYAVLWHAGMRRLGLPALRPWDEALAAYLEGRIEAGGVS